MNSKEILEDIRTQIAALKAKGQDSVLIENLERYCDQVEKDLTKSFEHLQLQHQSNLEQYKATNALEIERMKSQSAANVEMFKAVIGAGLDVLKAAVLINGGAVVVLLGFLSTVASKGDNPALGLFLTRPLLAFGTGVFLAAVALAFRYFSQDAYGGHQYKLGRPGYKGYWWPVANCLKAGAITFAVLSFAAFSVGTWNSYNVLAAHFEVEMIKIAPKKP